MNKKILVVLPSPLMARNFLRSGALNLLAAGGTRDIVVASPNKDDGALVESAGGRWLPYYHPRRSVTGPGLIANLTRRGRYLRYLAGLAMHMSLTYRFNVKWSFGGFSGRVKQSWRVRKTYLREGLPMSTLFGFPFPHSIMFYNLLKGIYYSGWQSFGPVNRLVREIQPDVILLSMVQTHMVTPYALAAVRANVPTLGMVGSWDQPTTKGPICPGMTRFAVQNEIVRTELIRYHDIAPDQIDLVGWLQMDAYARTGGEDQDVSAKFNLAPGTRYILFAANAPRLGEHEPGIVRDLAARAQAGEFGKGVIVLCRCHPQDTSWKSRWGWAEHEASLVVQPPDLGPLEHLTAVISHASVVVASAGSINLDAVALDVPTIGIAWEDESLPYWDRPARAYDLEHLAELRTSEGMAFATDLPSLVAACKRYMNDRSLDAKGREHLRSRYLYRLDGKAAERLCQNVEKMLK